MNDEFSPLGRRVSNLESALGVEQWKFEFCFPPEHTLLVTFRAEFNSEPVPEMSTTYHIVPHWPSEQTNGQIDIYFYHSPFQTKLPEKSRWFLHFDATNERIGLMESGSISLNDFTSHVSPFDPSTHETGKGHRLSLSNVPSLQPGREYDVWEYRARGVGSDEAGQEPYEFKYSLTVRMEQLSGDEELGQVARLELPK